jgi:DNA-binding transcriptional MocR family regulator
MAKPYKQHKRGGAGRHVQLPEWLQASEAWQSLKPSPRALYVELKRRYNGGNNGAIFMSHRDAATALNVSRNTVGPWFRELEDKGFIRLTQAPHLGPSGIGQASMWALTELPTKGSKSPTKDFMSWRKIQHPRKNTGTARPKIRDSNRQFEPDSQVYVPRTGTG